MSRMPPVKILTAAKLKGPAWAKKYPEKANDLYVVATFGKKRKARRQETMAEAEALRDRWEAAAAVVDLSSRGVIGQPLAELIAAFQRETKRDYAAKTREQREYQLSTALAHLGAMKPGDSIDAKAVEGFYDALRGDRSHRTAMSYLDALSRVFRHHGMPNPVVDARTAILEKRPQTAATRALDEANCNPVASGDMVKLWGALKPDDLTVALACHDGGLRIGESTGLRWERVTFGEDPDDIRRSVEVRGQRNAGKVSDYTKSGRVRTVVMSRRWRAHLLALWMERGRPSSGWVTQSSDHKGMNRRLGEICKRLKIPRVHYKDLRDTYASVLITHGIVLYWISRQLGHANVATTEKHYARYMAVDGYRNPWAVPEGMVPGDLFEELESGRTIDATSVTKVFKPAN